MCVGGVGVGLVGGWVWVWGGVVGVGGCGGGGGGGVCVCVGGGGVGVGGGGGGGRRRDSPGTATATSAYTTTTSSTRLPRPPTHLVCIRVSHHAGQSAHARHQLSQRQHLLRHLCTGGVPEGCFDENIIDENKQDRIDWGSGRVPQCPGWSGPSWPPTAGAGNSRVWCRHQQLAVAQVAAARGKGAESTVRRSGRATGAARRTCTPKLRSACSSMRPWCFVGMLRAAAGWDGRAGCQRCWCWSGHAAPSWQSRGGQGGSQRAHRVHLTPFQSEVLQTAAVSQAPERVACAYAAERVNLGFSADDRVHRCRPSIPPADQDAQAGIASCFSELRQQPPTFSTPHPPSAHRTHLQHSALRPRQRCQQGS